MRLYRAQRLRTRPARPPLGTLHQISSTCVVTTSLCIVILLTSGERDGSMVADLFVVAGAGASTWMMASAFKVRQVTLGAVTAGVYLPFFAIKYLLGGAHFDYGIYGPLRFAPTEAITIASIFLIGFSVAYGLRIRYAGTRGRFRHVGYKVPGESASATLALLLVASIALSVRYFAATRYNIGVPGEAPTAVRFAGFIYYTSAYVPLAVIGLLLVARRPTITASSNTATISRHGRQLAALLVALVYALLGSSIGYRSYALTAALVLIVAGGVDRQGMRPLLSGFLGFGLATFGVLMGLRTRGGGGSFVGITGTYDFLSRRFGGLDYLSPVVADVAASGAVPARLLPWVWDNYLLVDIYRFPPGAKTGFVGTGIGYLFAAGGITLIVAGGIFFGLAARWADSIPAGSSSALLRLLHLATILGWLNFLLEGTPLISVYMTASLGLFWYLPLRTGGLMGHDRGRRPPGRSGSARSGVHFSPRHVGNPSPPVLLRRNHRTTG